MMNIDPTYRNDKILEDRSNFKNYIPIFEIEII